MSSQGVGAERPKAGRKAGGKPLTSIYVSAEREKQVWNAIRQAGDLCNDQMKMFKPHPSGIDMLFHQPGFSALASALFLITAPTFAADFITAPLEPIPNDLVAQFARADQQRDALIDKAHKLVAAFLEKRSPRW